MASAGADATLTTTYAIASHQSCSTSDMRARDLATLSAVRMLVGRGDQKGKAAAMPAPRSYGSASSTIRGGNCEQLERVPEDEAEGGPSRDERMMDGIDEEEWDGYGESLNRGALEVLRTPSILLTSES